MFRITVFNTFLVCSWAVTALPSSASSAQNAYSGANALQGELVSSATILQFQQTIQLQAQTIQGLIQCGQHPTTQTAAACAFDEQVSSAVSAAVARLEQKIQIQALTIQGLIELVQNVSTPISSTTPTPTAHCASAESVASAVNAAVSAALAPLEQSVQELKRKLPRCNDGYEYYQASDKCYKMQTLKTDWPQANTTCVMNGGHLAVIHSRDEARFLGDLVMRSTDEAFIGVYQDSNRVWRTVTGERPAAAAGYNLWHNGEPVGDSNNKYAYIRQDGTLNDGYLVRYSICEKNPAS